MQFDKLRLTGFKSFVEPTEVLIEPGLTGVVGPNGCGKSNLLEALRWVMGEASYKSVRGTSMDDVIFAGSAKRATRDTAEVTLVLDNAARRAPAELNKADTLEVTRRIQRALGSDYRVNGRAVRARDVQVLFADAATGSRSPSMVRQGQVAELIAQKPVERRIVLEEAAGVSGLRARRHEAALKLNAAEANLSRIEDVTHEVERQIESLRRQARQAARYKSLGSEIRRLEATVHHLRWVNARAAVRAADEALTVARAAHESAKGVQERTAIDEAAARHAVPPLREAAAAAGESRRTIAADIAAIDARHAEAARRLETLAGQCAALERDLAHQKGTEADADAALQRLAQEDAELARRAESGAERVAMLQAEAERLAQAARESDRRAARATEVAAEALAAQASAKRTLERAESEASAAEQDVARLARKLRELAQSDAVTAANAASERVRTLQVAEADAAAELVEAEARLPQVRERDAKAHRAAQTLAAERAERETEARALERLVAMLGACEDAVLAQCKVTRGFEAAFAAALGDDLNAPCSADAPVRWVGSEVGGDAPLPADATPLCDLVRAPPQLERRLRQVGVVSHEEGARIAPTLAAGQRLVSADGALWRWDGLCRDAGAASPAAELLSHQNRIAVLEAELAELTPRQAHADAAARDARSALVGATKAEVSAREALQRARKATIEARAAQSSAEARARKADDERRSAEAAHALAEERVDATLAARDDARAAAAKTEDASAQVAAREAARQQAKTAAEAATQAAFDQQGEERSAVARERRRERIASETAEWRRRTQDAAAHTEDLTKRLAEAKVQREALAATPSEDAHQRAALARRLEAAKSAEGEQRAALERAEASERTAIAAAREALDALSETREERGRAEERVSGAANRLDQVTADLREALDVPPEGAMGLAGLAADDPLPDLSAATTRLEKLKGERQRLGSVNLCAEDELAEIEERRGAMAAERDDLMAAIAKLREGIGELNAEARGKLTGAFDTVNSQFQRLFTHLFDGGEASLVLTDADDPLEAGLDIIARPPGKKPQSLSLLSGGEQTLTATALIFAVFLTNPAPICVLDEIDAPLDDANVERFCALLEEMDRSTDTRFLIITHNPITMSRMHRLYGVTMVEKGVSQLVSVTLEAAEELRESA